MAGQANDKPTRAVGTCARKLGAPAFREPVGVGRSPEEQGALPTHLQAQRCRGVGENSAPVRAEVLNHRPAPSGALGDVWRHFVLGQSSGERPGMLPNILQYTGLLV